MANSTTLEEIIASLRKAGSKDIGTAIATKAAVNLEETLKETLAAGESPEGKAWTPRKKDGKRPYVNAASRVKVRSSGDVVRATITGPEVYGHYGVRGMPVRQMLPDAGAAIPESVSSAIVRAARSVLEETVIK